MADDTVLRLRTLRKLTTWLEGVNGTLFQLGVANMDGRVFRGRVIFGESDPIPMLSILETPIPLDQIDSPADSVDSTGDWELLVQGFAEDDKDNPTDPAHVLMAATKSRLAELMVQNRDFNILGMGNHITRIRVGSGVVRPPDEISAKAYFWLGVSLTIVENLLDPFED